MRSPARRRSGLPRRGGSWVSRRARSASGVRERLRAPTTVAVSARPGDGSGVDPADTWTAAEEALAQFREMMAAGQTLEAQRAAISMGVLIDKSRIPEERAAIADMTCTAPCQSTPPTSPGQARSGASTKSHACTGTRASNRPATLPVGAAAELALHEHASGQMSGWQRKLAAVNEASKAKASAQIHPAPADNPCSGKPTPEGLRIRPRST